MKNNKIAIIGSVGIPGNYGGFETLVECLTKELAITTPITVYCSSKSYKIRRKQYNGATLKYIPLNANGIQSIPYDILSLFHAAFKNDTILILGVSGCIVLPIFRFFFKRTKLIINIDGLEHKREKWQPSIQKFLKFSEKSAIRYGDKIIADNKAIQQYIKDEYGKDSNLIAYGGDHVDPLPLSEKIKKQYALPEKYCFKVCRIEEENNIHIILEAFSNTSFTIVIVGNWDNGEYGRKLKRDYSGIQNIIILDAIYNQEILNQIRSNSWIYIHGHSAGGTNPSLVEAMNLSLPIFAFDVIYNRETTLNKAKYFKNSRELQNLLNSHMDYDFNILGETMGKLAKENYTWKKIAYKYKEIFHC